jgi:Domain of unknown function (DUF1844)
MGLRVVILPVLLCIHLPRRLIMSESENGQFRIVDKRGQPDEEKPAPGKGKNDGPDRHEEVEEEAHKTFEEVNFVSFLLSLYSSAMAAFGKIPDPVTGKEEPHIEAGKQMIDILGILEEKTRGNLNEEESHLMDNILYELRMIYLEKTQHIKL